MTRRAEIRQEQQRGNDGKARSVSGAFMLDTCFVLWQNFQGEFNLAPSLWSQLITVIGVGGSRSHHIHTQTDTSAHRQTHPHTDRHIHIRTQTDTSTHRQTHPHPHSEGWCSALVLLCSIQSRSPACGGDHTLRVGFPASVKPIQKFLTDILRGFSQRGV